MIHSGNVGPFLSNILLGLGSTGKMTPFTTGKNHSIFVTSLGDVYACGSNSFGELGLDSKSIHICTPTKSNNLPPIKSAAAGNNFSIFLDFDGNVWGAGKSDFGQLGRILLLEGVTAPEKLALPVPIQTVAASHNFFSIFLDINGNVWACGSSRFGQLGLSDYTAQNYLPTMVPSLPAITDISVFRQRNECLGDRL